MVHGTIKHQLLLKTILVRQARWFLAEESWWPRRVCYSASDICRCVRKDKDFYLSLRNWSDELQKYSSNAAVSARSAYSSIPGFALVNCSSCRVFPVYCGQCLSKMIRERKGVAWPATLCAFPVLYIFRHLMGDRQLSPSVFTLEQKWNMLAELIQKTGKQHHLLPYRNFWDSLPHLNVVVQIKVSGWIRSKLFKTSRLSCFWTEISGWPALIVLRWWPLFKNLLRATVTM